MGRRPPDARSRLTYERHVVRVYRKAYGRDQGAVQPAAARVPVAAVGRSRWNCALQPGLLYVRCGRPMRLRLTD